MSSQSCSSALRFLVGLGNPGNEYANTRHNAGFWFIDDIARQLGASFKKESKFFGEVAKVRGAQGDIYLLKPTTFMNRSGQAVQAVANFYQLSLADLLVIHDELDLAPGVVKLKKGGGTGGHNGLKDIQSKMGGPDYWRLRIGIGHPRTLNLNQDVADFVLHPARREEQQAIDANRSKVLEILPSLFAGDLEGAMRALHTQS